MTSVWGQSFGATDVQRSPERHAPTHDSRGEDPMLGLMPVGGCFWWWGTAAQLPEDFRIVDGSFAVNGVTVPDMRNKMPIGAGTTYALGDTGGATAATLSSHVGTAVAAHADHRHTASVGAGTQAGASFNSWKQDTSPQSSIEDPAVTTHTVTQPDDHVAVSTLPPYAAFYFVMRVR